MFIVLLIFSQIVLLSSNATAAKYSCDEKQNHIWRQTQTMFQQSKESFPLKEGPYTVGDIMRVDCYFTDLCNSYIPGTLGLLSQVDLRPNDQIYDNLEDALRDTMFLQQEKTPEFHLDIPTLAQALEEIPSQIYSMHPDPSDVELLKNIEPLSIHQELLLACKALYESDWDLAYQHYDYWYFCVTPRDSRDCALCSLLMTGGDLEQSGHTFIISLNLCYISKGLVWVI
ncbi:MAG: hypothetical protein OXC30_00330 [Alphaproteobacteria bacterium]|nr:hypothetical protein [Alphaproteobacteria bacterium]